MTRMIAFCIGGLIFSFGFLGFFYWMIEEALHER